MNSDKRIKELLIVMDFKDLRILPSMKILRERFRHLAVQRHPDKGGTDEAFKELFKAYEILGNLITSRKTQDKEDEEEMEAKRMFREENWEEVNTSSITIRVHSTDGDNWKAILEIHYGSGVKNSKNEKDNKGEKFMTTFTHDDEECKMYTTLYNPSKTSPDI